MKVFEIYNYMYYRLAKWYFKYEDKDEKLSSGAFIIVTISQFIILTDILGFYMIENFTREPRTKIMTEIFPFYISFFILLIIINGVKYYNSYKNYNEKWKNESKKEKNIRGIVVYSLIILPLIFIPIILNIKDYTQ